MKADRPPPRSILCSTLLVVTTIAVGLMLRFVPVGLPVTLTKYGGSMLWAAMIYWIVSSVLRRWSFARAGLLSLAAATSVELFQLYHAAPLDAFRRTLLGALLLGRVFSTLDLVAYAVAIGCAVMVDRAIRGASLYWRGSR